MNGCRHHAITLGHASSHLVVDLSAKAFQRPERRHDRAAVLDLRAGEGAGGGQREAGAATMGNGTAWLDAALCLTKGVLCMLVRYHSNHGPLPLASASSTRPCQNARRPAYREL